MPATNEWSFTSEVATWITQILEVRPDLPFKNARVEKPDPSSQKRNDLVIYGRDGKPAISGEVKMPDKVNGGTPYNAVVVKDAHDKADHLSVAHFFTWNVNKCVLWNTFEQGVPLMERRLAHYDVLSLPIRKSDDTEQPRVQEHLKRFLVELLERCAAALSGEKPLELNPPDELFLKVWEAALEQPVMQTLAGLWERYDKDMPFTREIDQWMRQEQEWVISHTDEQIKLENLERASKLSCYVLATKIIFYKALRRRFKTMKALQIPDSVTTGAELAAKLTGYFEEAMQISGDYQTVFREQYGDRLAFLNDASVENWRELSKQTDGFDFTQINYEIVGQIFERMLSTEERHKYGQHYTRSEVVDLINAFCIRKADAVVMDPACGGGTFLVRAYNRKKQLSEGGLAHQELLRQLYGLDISAYPAHLTTINLATRDLINKANYPLVARHDFFKTHVGDSLFFVPMGLGQTVMEPIEPVDAIVGNPPYVRQEKITEYYGDKYKTELRETAEKDAPDSGLSGRSDIHCYFFTHALSYCKPGGGSYIGLLVSSTWLDTGYGFRLQKFLLDNFEIVAIFESACEPWFTGARVTTAAVILRHQPDARKRAENLVKFVLISQPLSELFTTEPGETDSRMTFDQLRTRIEELQGQEEFLISTGTGETVTIRQETLPGMRVRVVRQSGLFTLGRLPFEVSEADEMPAGETSAGDGEETEEAEGETGEPENGEEAENNALVPTPTGEYGGYKWGIFLRGPDIFFKLLRLGGNRFRPLGQIARIKFGVKSGCDKFFFVQDKTAEALAAEPEQEAFRDRYGIERKDTAEIRIVEAGDKTQHLIEAQYLEPLAFNLMEVNTAEISPERLKKRILLVSDNKDDLQGTHVLKYIEWGEEEGFDSRSTCANRRRWYELPIPERGDMLWTMIQRYRHIVPVNASAEICNKSLFNINPSDAKLSLPLAAVLNSTVMALHRYCYGRMQGGDPVNKSEVVDVKMMLAPDPQFATPAVQKRLTDALAGLRQRTIHHLVAVDSNDPNPTGDLAHADRQELDDAVLELLGIADPEERHALCAELYGEMTRLYRSIRATEKRMNEFKARSKSKGKITPRSIANEIWQRMENKLFVRPLSEFAVTQDTEKIELPTGKIRAVHNLMYENSLFVEAERRYIPLQHPERVVFAEALHKARISGAVAIPTSPEDCRTALLEKTSHDQQTQAQFDDLAAEYTADEALQKRIVQELLRKARATGD